MSYPHPVDWPTLLTRPSVNQLVALALKEDIGDGDITTQSVFTEPVPCRAQIVSRGRTVACGMPLAQYIFGKLSSTIEARPLVEEGAWVEAGTPVLSIAGDVRGVLTAERCVLNFLMRLCGVATNARRASEAIPEECVAHVFDTRKTMPGWRLLDKAAVRTGGASNHRVGLFDAVLIKDNHIAAAGSVGAAIRSARARTGNSTVVEVEIDTLEQLEEALAGQPDIILLDNFSLEAMREAVVRADNSVELEASGGITLANIADIARTGVHRISLGALTHTVVPADLSLDVS